MYQRNSGTEKSVGLRHIWKSYPCLLKFRGIIPYLDCCLMNKKFEKERKIL